MLDLSVALFFDFLGSLEEKAYLCRYNFIILQIWQQFI